MPGFRQHERRHGIDRSIETLGQRFGHVVAGLVSRMQEGMSGHHAGDQQVCGALHLQYLERLKVCKERPAGRVLNAVQQDRPRRLEARATAANSLCGSYGCGDGVTTTEQGPSRWRNGASAGSREACPPGVTTVIPIGLDGSR